MLFTQVAGIHWWQGDLGRGRGFREGLDFGPDHYSCWYYWKIVLKGQVGTMLVIRDQDFFWKCTYSPLTYTQHYYNLSLASVTPYNWNVVSHSHVATSATSSEKLPTHQSWSSWLTCSSPYWHLFLTKCNSSHSSQRHRWHCLRGFKFENYSFTLICDHLFSI